MQRGTAAVQPAGTLKTRVRVLLRRQAEEDYEEEMRHPADAGSSDGARCCRCAVLGASFFFVCFLRHARETFMVGEAGRMERCTHTHTHTYYLPTRWRSVWQGVPWADSVLGGRGGIPKKTSASNYFSPLTSQKSKNLGPIFFMIVITHLQHVLGPLACKGDSGRYL